MKINKKKGILFWITGLSGSGKTTLGKKIFKQIVFAGKISPEVHASFSVLIYNFWNSNDSYKKI